MDDESFRRYFALATGSTSARYELSHGTVTRVAYTSTGGGWEEVEQGWPGDLRTFRARLKAKVIGGTYNAARADNVPMRIILDELESRYGVKERTVLKLAARAVLPST
jgi:hypothetical protein